MRRPGPPVLSRLGRCQVVGALVVMVMLLAACGDGASDDVTATPAAAASVEESARSTESPAVDLPTSPPATTPSRVSAPTPTSAPATPTVEAASATPVPSPTPVRTCERIDDFAGADAGGQWRIVDDGVMGGRSAGAAGFADDAMQYGGTIDTNGGGFSSVRRAVAASALAEATEIRIRARPDARTYELIVDDATSDGRVSHFGVIPFTEPGAWQEVSVAFAALEARVFGTPVEAAPFRPDQATALGLILADGADGPFALDVDWIDACR